MHFGIISSPVPGHLNPLCTIGRELVSRGHRVTCLSIPDTEELICSGGIKFYPIGQEEFPVGTFQKVWGPLMRRYGAMVTLRSVLIHRSVAKMMCREIPDIIKNLAIDLLLIDQIQYQGAAIARCVNRPFITISCALHVNRSTGYQIPTPFVSWSGKSKKITAIWRNKFAWFIFDLFSNPILRTGDVLTKGKSEKVCNVEDSFSKIAQIIPMPQSLDWDIRFNEQSRIHYVGSLTDYHHNVNADKMPVRNSCKPIIYVSFGTLQNENIRLLKLIDAALLSLEVDVIIALGNWGNIKSIRELKLNAKTYQYAPQKQILKSASLCITHGGMNTVAESLTFGVPMIVIPLANDQPALAQRVVEAGVGVRIRVQKVSTRSIKNAVQSILHSEVISNNVKKIRDEISIAGGVIRAADVIENASKKCFQKS